MISSSEQYDSGYRDMMFGPANFTGLPPRWLMVEGGLLGVLGAAFIAGAPAAGVLTGHRAVGVSAGILVALGIAVYLFFTNAGRALLGAVALLGVVLAWWVPGAVAEAYLAERGEARTVVVAAVHEHHYRGRDYVNYSCSVRLPDGTPVDARAGRNCLDSTEPGDRLSMVFDPRGVIAATDRLIADSWLTAGVKPAALTLLLAAVCFTAVVRSCP